VLEIWYRRGWGGRRLRSYRCSRGPTNDVPQGLKALTPYRSAERAAPPKISASPQSQFLHGLLCGGITRDQGIQLFEEGAVALSRIVRQRFAIVGQVEKESFDTFSV
jgi:hypothetical protein